MVYLRRLEKDLSEYTYCLFLNSYEHRVRNSMDVADYEMKIKFE